MSHEDAIAQLRELNPGLDIRPVEDAAFAGYGRLVQDDGLPELISYLRANTPVGEGSRYTASDLGAEALACYKSLQRRVFGDQDIQIGWCNGTNALLNALEYHASIEVDVAASDAVLLLAKKADCVDGQIDAGVVRGFYVRAGQAVLLESGTLHFAPCAVTDDGFRVAIVLPRGTNTPLENRRSDDAPLWMQNKWLLAHCEAAHLVDAGATIGLTGERIALRRMR